MRKLDLWDFRTRCCLIECVSSGSKISAQQMIRMDLMKDEATGLYGKRFN